MRFQAHLDLRVALETMIWRDVEIIVEEAVERELQQYRRDENLAMLLDRWHFYLESEYSSWVTDPTDPDVKAERRKREAKGIKPPPRPLLFPVALRHPDRAEQLLDTFRAEHEKYSRPQRPAMTIADLMAARGIRTS